MLMGFMAMLALSTLPHAAPQHAWQHRQARLASQRLAHAEPHPKYVVCAQAFAAA
jgi:hypothetical protein